jgi:hypothetical protein
MKTAVEWLLENLITEPYSEAHFKHNSECWDKAEEMEKQQIVEAYDKAGKSVYFGTGYMLSEKERKDFLIIAEKYYNGTFKSEE